MKSSRIEAYKSTQVFFFMRLFRKQTVQACFLWMNDSRIYWNMKIARDDSAVNFGCSDWRGPPPNASERCQSNFLVVLSKGSRCNYWGFLDCDDRRSPRWVSCVGPQHHTVMISMSFTNYASLAIISSFLFCSVFCFFFWTRNFIHYTSVSCVWLLL